MLQSSAFSESPGSLNMQSNDFEKDYRSVLSLARPPVPGETNEVKRIEAIAEEIDKKWLTRNKEQHGRLMLEICRPLSSQDLKDERRHEVARKYALSALAEPDAIPLTLELELTGHVITVPSSSEGTADGDFAERRKQDVTIRLHAWKRLVNAIDPAWNPDEQLMGGNVGPPLGTGLPAGVDPSAIKDAKLRAQYEAAIQENRQKLERYREQYELRKWLKRFPKRAESYIVDANSRLPYETAELQRLLNEYEIDSQSKARILDAVHAAIAKQSDSNQR